MTVKNKLNKKNITLLILILGLIVLVVSTSYAVFSIRHENSNNQIVSAGELELTYNSCSTMTTEMVPMSNEDGIAQAGCNVTVENTGSLDAIYKVLIYNNSSGSNHLSHDNLYISIDNSTSVLLSTITKLEDTEKYNLKEDILLVGNTRSHNIKMWIKEDATTDIVGKSVNLIVDIEAEVAPEPNFLASEPLSNPQQTNVFWGGTITRDLVEEITFTTTNVVPTGVIGSWDAGLKKNGKVMAWYTDTDNNSKYEVVVGAEGGVYAPVNSKYLFQNFQNLKSLNLTNINTSRTTNMAEMFASAGYSNPNFTLDLGDEFDTSNVTNMFFMFIYTGMNSTVFTLELGDKFDTSNVTDMTAMFDCVGYSNPNFILNLGDKFNTSNVTDMSAMFAGTGYSNPNFILNLEDMFDTSNVIDMCRMFADTGHSSLVFTLNLGNKFDTSNVTNMESMFSSTGYNSTSFTLDLGDKFDTSNVENMRGMFASTGNNSSMFTLDLGDKFDTSSVTDMGFSMAGEVAGMFAGTGRNSTSFTLDLGDKFDTSNVENMSGMFAETGYSSSIFTLDLGDNFDISNVTDISSMFRNTGYLNATFTLDLRNFVFNGDIYTDYSTFATSGWQHTIYASSNNIDFISDSNKGFTGTIINCTTTPASCPQ